MNMEVGLTKYNLYPHLIKAQNSKPHRKGLERNNTSNISFQSRIEFVDYEKFYYIFKHLKDMQRGKEVHFWKTSPPYEVGNILYTDEIRTCTGVGLTNRKKAAGSHWLDKNYQYVSDWCTEMFNEFVEKLNPQQRTRHARKKFTRCSIPKSRTTNLRSQNQPQILNISGLIVGGKNLDDAPHSAEMTEAIINQVKDRVKHLSIFQDHLHVFGETSYIYNLKDDKWTLAAKYFDINEKCSKNVSNLEDLINFYRRIYIADGDELYINGEKIPREIIESTLNNRSRERTVIKDVSILRILHPKK